MRKYKCFSIIILTLCLFSLTSCLEETYTTTYVVNGKTYSVVNSNSVSPLSYQNNYGCTFFGWYQDFECQTLFTDYQTSIEQDLTLYGVSLSYLDLLKNQVYLNVSEGTNQYQYISTPYQLTLGIMEKEELYLQYQYQESNITRLITYYPERNIVIQEYQEGEQKIIGNYLVSENYERNTFSFILSTNKIEYFPNTITLTRQRELLQLCNEGTYNILNLIFYECNKLISPFWNNVDNYQLTIPSFKQKNQYYNLSTLEMIKATLGVIDMEYNEFTEFELYQGEGLVKGLESYYQNVPNNFEKYMIVLEFDSEENAFQCYLDRDGYYLTIVQRATYATDLVLEYNQNYVYIYTSNAEYIKR